MAEAEDPREVLPPPVAVKLGRASASSAGKHSSSGSQSFRACDGNLHPANDDGSGHATSFKVRVNVVTVRAVVRDKQGHFVDDLKKEDFELVDGSKPQVITGFSVERAADEKAQPSKEVACRAAATVKPCDRLRQFDQRTQSIHRLLVRRLTFNA